MKDFNTILNNMVTKVKAFKPVELQDIPNIDLYMDQVTTFMDAVLEDCKRSSEDKILTKTMINNYAKAKIFPPPVKKKYTKNHIMLLIIIYHLKTILSIHDISILLRPITEEINKDPHSKALEKIYEYFVCLQKANNDNLSKAVSGNYDFITDNKDSLEAFEDKHTKLILVILLLTIQANTEKRLAEKILDNYFTDS